MVSNKFKRERARIAKQFILHEEEIKTETKTLSKQKILIKELEELNSLFDDILGEVEERQIFLESLDGLNSQKLELKTKEEMKSRLNELKKITKMISDVKKELKNVE